MLSTYFAATGFGWLSTKGPYEPRRATCERPETSRSTSRFFVLLVALAMGSLFGYRGNTIVIEGEGREHADPLRRLHWRSLVDTGELMPFSFTLDEFTARYEEDPGDQRGAPRDYDAAVSYRTPGDGPKTYDIRVNSPLVVDGTKVFLLNHGYAPRVTVRDGEGNVVLQGAVPFIPETASTWPPSA